MSADGGGALFKNDLTCSELKPLMGTYGSETPVEATPPTDTVLLLVLFPRLWLQALVTGGWAGRDWEDGCLAGAVVGLDCWAGDAVPDRL